MENPNISANTKRKSNKFNSFNDEDNILESNNSGDSQYHISNYLFDRVFNQQDEKIKEVKIELSNLKNELKNELKNGFENKWKATDDSIKQAVACIPNRPRACVPHTRGYLIDGLPFPNLLSKLPLFRRPQIPIWPIRQSPNHPPKTNQCAGCFSTSLKLRFRQAAIQISYQ